MRFVLRVRSIPDRSGPTGSPSTDLPDLDESRNPPRGTCLQGSVRPEPMMVAIYWNLLFTTLNLYWIARLTIERRPVQLTGNDLRLYQVTGFDCRQPMEILERSLFLLRSAAAAGVG